jgi:hypothetical protein
MIRDFSICYIIYTCSGAHPESYQTACSFLEGNSAGTWYWPLSFIQGACRSLWYGYLWNELCEAACCSYLWNDCLRYGLWGGSVLHLFAGWLFIDMRSARKRVAVCGMIAYDMSSVRERFAVVCGIFVNMIRSVKTYVAVTWIRDGRW